MTYVNKVVRKPPKSLLAVHVYKLASLASSSSSSVCHLSTTILKKQPPVPIPYNTKKNKNMSLGFVESDLKEFQQKNTQSQKNKPLLLGTKATWLAVTEAPPLATLDDILLEIQRVVSTELKRGILDLTKTELLMKESLVSLNHSNAAVATTTTAAAETTTIEATAVDTTDVEFKEVENIGIHISLQEDEDDDEDEDDNGCGEEEDENTSSRHSMFPLWTPQNNENNHPLPTHLVIEAHIMLSTLARPMGFYLKFPDRSVVHAILQHVQEAEQIRESFKKKQKRKRMLRKQKLLNIHTDNNNDDNNEYRSSQHPRESIQKEEEDTVFSQNDLETDELFSWQYHTTRPLICAGKELAVQPFFFIEQIINPTTLSSFNTSGSTSSYPLVPPMPTKEDVLSVPNMITSPFYHQYKTLVDDTVIRVENCSIDSTIDDIRYFFRRFDLKQDHGFNSSSSSSSSIPAILSIEGPMNHGNPHEQPATSSYSKNIDTQSITSLKSGKPTSKSYSPAKFENNKKSTLSTITPINTKTFLVRFQTSAHARAAIRELQYAELLGRRVKLAQYSRQILPHSNI